MILNNKKKRSKIWKKCRDVKIKKAQKHHWDSTKLKLPLPITILSKYNETQRSCTYVEARVHYRKRESITLPHRHVTQPCKKYTIFYINIHDVIIYC